MRVGNALGKYEGKAVSNIIFNLTTPRKLANPGINADLLRQSKQLNINLPQTQERHLA